MPTLLLVLVSVARAEDKKEEKKKEPPRVIMVSPLAVAAGETSVVKIRGIGLADVSSVVFSEPEMPLQVVIKSKIKSDPPKPLDAVAAGDSQLELELTVPLAIPAGTISFTVISPAGESKPHEIVVAAADLLVDEKEPNGGFHEAQEIALGKTIRGSIGEAMDVDVFKFGGKAGQMIVAEVRAARLGSALDSTLTLYDTGGHVVAVNDDGPAGADSLLKVKLPADGVYYLTLTDANDRGGAAHPYLLSIRSTE